MDIDKNYIAWTPNTVSFSAEKKENQQFHIRTLAAYLSEMITEYLADQYNVELEMILDEATFDGAFSEIRSDESMYLYAPINEDNNQMGFVYAPLLVNILLDTYLLGRFDIQKKLTEGDEEIGVISKLAFDKFTNIIGGRFFNLINKIYGISYTPNSQEEFDHNFHCLAVKIFFDKNNKDAYLTLYLSHEFINTFLALSNARDGDHAASGSCDETTFELAALLDTKSVTLDYLNQLTEGDLIPVETNSKVTLKLGNNEMLTGVLGQTKHTKSVKIITNKNSIAE